MDSCKADKESEFLKSECKRLCEKIRAANSKGCMGPVFRRGEEMKAEKAANPDEEW